MTATGCARAVFTEQEGEMVDIHGAMMKCGHSANSILHHKDGDKPACVICDCFEVTEVPDLTGRQARCAYYGKTFRPRRNECNTCAQQPDNICRCERPSTMSLAFFAHHPTEEFDEFYCGCAVGWD